MGVLVSQEEGRRNLTLLPRSQPRSSAWPAPGQHLSVWPSAKERPTIPSRSPLKLLPEAISFFIILIKSNDKKAQRTTPQLFCSSHHSPSSHSIPITPVLPSTSSQCRKSFVQPLLSPGTASNCLDTACITLAKNTAGSGPDAGKAWVTGIEQGQMLTSHWVRVLSITCQVSKQQHFQAALQSIIISGDCLQFLTTGCEKGTERRVFFRVPCRKVLYHCPREPGSQQASV